jgi:hypothetical protein
MNSNTAKMERITIILLPPATVYPEKLRQQPAQTIERAGWVGNLPSPQNGRSWLVQPNSPPHTFALETDEACLSLNILDLWRCICC